MVGFLSLLVSALAVIMIVSTLIQFHRRKIPAAWAMFWSGIWVVGATLTFFTGWLDWLVSLVYAGNSSDLVVYVSIMLLLLFNYRQFMQYQSLKAEMSNLVTQVAKQNAKKGKR